MRKTLAAAALATLCAGFGTVAAASGLDVHRQRPEDLVPPFAADPELAAIGRDLDGLWSYPPQRVEAIIQRIFWQRDGIGFTYRAHPTLTATEAWQQRHGNCLSLVNLFVALARSADLKAFFVEVEDFEAFYRFESTVVRSTHVVGGVMIDGVLRTVDFLPDREKRYRRLRPISDERAIAHYFNAIGAEAMLGGDLERGQELFEVALSLDDRFPDPWNNYAVLRRRQGRLDDAIAALEKALDVDHHFLPAMENLATYYQLDGRAELAATMNARALGEKTRNPYFLHQQALNRFKEHKLDEAEQLLRRARRFDRKIPEIQLLLGRIELERGHTAKAEALFAKAKKLSEDYSDAFQRGLDTKVRKLMENG